MLVVLRLRTSDDAGFRFLRILDAGHLLNLDLGARNVSIGEMFQDPFLDATAFGHAYVVGFSAFGLDLVDDGLVFREFCSAGIVLYHGISCHNAAPVVIRMAPRFLGAVAAA